MSRPPWNPEPLDVDLRIVSPFEGWWTIERADHDGRDWTEGVRPSESWRDADYRQVLSTPERVYQSCGSYCCSSARLDKTTDVEGAEYELSDMLAAIRTWEPDAGDRWAIKPDGDTALVYSPRNSQTSTRVTRRALEAMVAEYESRAGGEE